MKLFVTGGTGFVGSHFLQQALAAGHDVIAQRRLGSRPRLQLTREPVWVDRALDQIFEAELAGCDALVHLASHTPNPPYAPLDECIYWNVFAAMKLVRAAAAADVQNFLIAGSYFEYGPPPRGSDFIETTTRLAPTQAYPISKAAASIVFEGFAREYSLKLKILRIFQVFGEGEHPNRMWPSMRRAALAGEDFPMSAGGQLRDFVRVEDVASQFVRHLDFSNVVPGMPEVLHAASGEAKTLLDFARHWWQVWGATGQLLPGRVPYRKNELFRLIPAPGSLA